MENHIQPRAGLPPDGRDGRDAGRIEQHEHHEREGRERGDAARRVP